MLHNQYVSFSCHLLIAVHMIRVSATGWRERRKCGLLELEIFNEIARDQGQPLGILQDLGLLAPSPILRFIIDFSTSFVLMTPKTGPVIRTQYRQCLINFEKGQVTRSTIHDQLHTKDILELSCSSLVAHSKRQQRR